MADEQSFDWKTLWQDIEFDDESRQKEVMQARLKQRAKQYATPLNTEQSDGENIRTVLAFELGGEVYGINVMYVRAIRTAPHITPVPGTPEFYRGVVNLRGRITTVMDLRYFFDVAIDEKSVPDELVVVNAQGLEMGLLVHHVQGIRDIRNAEIEAMSTIRYALGVTKDHLVLLDVNTMFEDDRLVIGGEE